MPTPEYSVEFLFLFNKLESLIMEEAVSYYTSTYNWGPASVNREFHDQKRAREYFDSVMQNKIYEEFELETYEWFRLMSSHELGKQLKSSFLLFRENIPENRVNILYSGFCKRIAPTIPPTAKSKLSNDEKRYMNIVLDKYNVHYGKFRQLPERLFNEYKANRLNLKEHIFTSKPVDAGRSLQGGGLPGAVEDNTFEKCRSAWLNDQMDLRTWKQSDKSYSLSKLVASLKPGHHPAKLVLKQSTRLYHEYVDELFSERFIHPFEDIDVHRKRTIAQDDLDIINSLLKGDVNSETAEKLTDLFNIDECKKARKQIERINRKRVNPEIHYDIHGAECLADAEVLVRYYDFLNEYCQQADAGKQPGIRNTVTRDKTDVKTLEADTAREEPGGIHPGTPDQPDCPVKDFKEYLLLENKDLWVSELVNLFNARNSPKDYAMMVCLLSQNQMISIPFQKRKPFYIAWYKHIGKSLPNRENFSAVNKYIADHAVNGFQFKDESDVEYLQVSDKFENLIQSFQNHKI